MVDVRDVADCAAALLTADAPPADRLYDVTGPSAVRMGVEWADAISELRPRPVAIDACTIEEYLAPRGLPPQSVRNHNGLVLAEVPDGTPAVT